MRIVHTTKRILIITHDVQEIQIILLKNKNKRGSLQNIYIRQTNGLLHS